MRGRRSELVGFRFPQELRRRWRTYLALVLLLGLVGGVALGSIAAARTTQSSFPAFLKTTNPSDLDIDNGPFDPALLRRVAKLPGVTSVQTYVAVNIAPVHPDGTADVNNPFGDAEAVGTLSKLYISQDKITIIDGRMLDPRRPDEIVVSKFFADLAHLHVGQRVPVGVFSNAQITSEGVPASPAAQRLTLTIVGIGVFNDEVVQDDVDKIPRYVVSPVLARRVVGCCVTYAWSGVQLTGGAAAVPPVLHEYVSRLGSASLLYIHITSTIEGQAERAVKPLSLALGVFGLIAGAAALLIAAQLIARVVRTSGGDREVLRALGGDPVDTTADGLLGVAAALLLGTLLAGVVAVALSPLAPFGPVREVLGPRGLSFDWTVLGLGMAVLLVGLMLIALLLSYRMTPHRLARRGGPVVRGSRVVDAAASSGLPAPAVAGIRFALTRGGGRGDAPVRSAILGTLLAVVVVVASLTFADSLDTLVSHPALYGWNWNYSLTANAGYGDVPAAAAAKALRADRSVAAWAGAYYALLDIDGESVPVLGASPHAALGPSQLSGHGLDGAGQVVLGSETLQDLHKKIGDTVVVDDGKTQTRLTIVGTATMPTVGVGHGLHLSMGTGAVLDYHVVPAIERNIQGESLSGPNVIFVRFRHGVNQTAALVGPPAGGQRGEPGLRIGGQRPPERCPAPGRDRQLPGHGLDPGNPGRRARPRFGGRPGADGERVGASPTAGARPVQDVRVHPSPAGGQRGLAGLRRRRGRYRGRDPARHRRRSLAVDGVRR